MCWFNSNIVTSCGRCCQVLINAAVTQAVVHVSKSDQSHHIAADNTSVLCDTHVVMKLLLSWRVWESADDSVWMLGLSAVSSLVRTGHPHQQYNIDQLYDAGVIAKVLDIWKVRTGHYLIVMKWPPCLYDLPNCSLF